MDQPINKHDLRFALVVTVQSATPDRQALVDVSVQVWNNNTHVTSVKLIDLHPTILPNEQDCSSLEQWAFLAARVTTRELDEALYSAIESVTLHKIEDYLNE